ncbi:MAG: tetratricopeptide repeat protein [Candidatus Saccharimonas sp.]
MNDLISRKVRDDTILKLESDTFDGRTNLGISGGVIKQSQSDDNISLEQRGAQRPLGLNKKYFESRIARERLLLSKQPKNIKLLNRVGDIYMANNKPDKAKQFFLRAFRQDTDSIVIALKLASVYMFLGKLEKAEELLNIFSDRHDSQISSLRAIINLGLNNLSKAEDLLLKVDKASANYYETANTLGLVYLIQKKFDLALDCFQESVKNNNSYTHAKNNIAVTYESTGKKEQAIKQYEKVIEEDSNYETAYNNLFNILVQDGNIDRAYKLISSARHLSTPDNEIQFRIAWSQMCLSRFDSAIQEYQRVLEILPGNSNTLNNIGFCYQKLGKVNEAVVYFEKALKAKSSTILPAKNLMLLFDKIGQFKKSRELASQILTFDQHDPYALTFVGNEHVDQENWDEALKCLTEAYESKPETSSLYISLIFLYTDIFPDYKKGKEVAKFVIDSGSADLATEQFYNNYVHFLLINNRPDDAKKYLSKLNDDSPVSLATTALFSLKKNKLKEGEDLFELAISKATSKLKDKVVQRKYYDLGCYYTEKSDHKRASVYFEKVIEVGDEGFKYILDESRKRLKNFVRTSSTE